MHKKQTVKPQVANPVHAEIEKSLQMLIENKELVFQFMDLLPVHIEIFTPDGTAIFLNQAFRKFNNIPDAHLITGSYNVLKDPILNDEMGFRDLIHRAFNGEKVQVVYSPPIYDLVDRGVIDEKPYEAAIMDLYFYPIFDKKKLLYVVSASIVKNVYQGRADLARMKEYIDTHWQGEYDKEKVAQEAGMSVAQLYRLF